MTTLFDFWAKNTPFDFGTNDFYVALSLHKEQLMSLYLTSGSEDFAAQWNITAKTALKYLGKKREWKKYAHLDHIPDGPELLNMVDKLGSIVAVVQQIWNVSYECIYKKVAAARKTQKRITRENEEVKKISAPPIEKPKEKEFPIYGELATPSGCGPMKGITLLKNTCGYTY